MSASIGALQPELQPWCRALLDACAGAGLNPRLTSTRRSHQEQVRLFRAAQAGQSPYPAARPGTSAHEYGWAFDMVVSPLSDLPDVGALWEEWGGVWGGHPTRRGSGYDPVHFEWPGWRSLVDFTAPDARQQIDDRGTARTAFDIATKTVYYITDPAEIVYEQLPTAVKDVLSYAPGPTGLYATAHQVADFLKDLF